MNVHPTTPRPYLQSCKQTKVALPSTTTRDSFPATLATGDLEVPAAATNLARDDWPHDRQPTHESVQGMESQLGEKLAGSTPAPDNMGSVKVAPLAEPILEAPVVSAKSEIPATPAPTLEKKKAVFSPEGKDETSQEKPKEEGFAPEPNLTIPDISDVQAPRPNRTQTSLTSAAIDRRLRRVMTPKSNGQLKVPARFVEQWRKGGTSRKSLEKIMASVGYNPDWGLQICLGRGLA